MSSAQHLAIGAAAVRLAGQEGVLFRKVVVWSIVAMLCMCALVYLQSDVGPPVDGGRLEPVRLPRRSPG